MNGKLKLPKQLSLIVHKVDGEIIHQRPVDGYINATDLCKTAGKLFADYRRLKTTEEFLNELSLDMGIPISMNNQGLIVSIAGVGAIEGKGTWVHPNVAIHLAQWLSPRFAVQVTKWVQEWLSGGFFSGNLPSHLRRYVANMGKIPYGYFSMLNEIIYLLVAPMEQEGYTLPDRLMPDISTGRMFSGFLRKKGIDPKAFPNYTHEFVDGTRPPVEARLYPNKYLGDFRNYMQEVWLPRQAIQYFEKKDESALPYLKIALIEKK